MQFVQTWVTVGAVLSAKVITPLVAKLFRFQTWNLDTVIITLGKAGPNSQWNVQYLRQQDFFSPSFIFLVNTDCDLHFMLGISQGPDAWEIDGSCDDPCLSSSVYGCRPSASKQTLQRDDDQGNALNSLKRVQNHRILVSLKTVHFKPSNSLFSPNVDVFGHAMLQSNSLCYFRTSRCFYHSFHTKLQEILLFKKLVIIFLPAGSTDVKTVPIQKSLPIIQEHKLCEADSALIRTWNLSLDSQ